MADKLAARKLQVEIFRCFKEGTETIGNIEDNIGKVYNAATAKPKEKYMDAFREEFKKLQNIREEINTWITAGEIEDTSILVETRKLLERHLEKFNLTEREIKRRDYSREGLRTPEKVDLVQKERDEIQQWLITSIGELTIQTDSLEIEMEKITLKSKKKKRKRARQNRMDQLNVRLEWHRFHIQKLELLLVMLVDESVWVEQIKLIKDNVDYYIESWNCLNFEDNEFIYIDILGLDEAELPVRRSPSSDSFYSGSTVIISPRLSPQPIDNNSTASTIILSPIPSPPPSDYENDIDFHDSISEPVLFEENIVQEDQPQPQFKPITDWLAKCENNDTNLVSNNDNATATTMPSDFDDFITEPVLSEKKIVHENQPPLKPKTQWLATFVNSDTNLVSNNDNGTATTMPSGKSTVSAATQTSPIWDILSIKPNRNFAESVATGMMLSNNYMGPNTLMTTKMVLPENLLGPLGKALMSYNTTKTALSNNEAGDRTTSSAPPSQKSEEQRQEKTEHRFPPGFVIAPLGYVPLQEENQQQMEAAYQQMSLPSYTERMPTPFPKMPCQTPFYYIQVPLINSHRLAFFQRLDDETLLVMFYYTEGTMAQFLAAIALKLRSWRYHVKYMTWFRRHHDPTLINLEYERGSYIYFDYVKWELARVDDFVFEYKFLEDTDVD